MTSMQIGALISLLFSTALVYWISYRNGLADGRKHQSEPRTRRKAA